MASEQDWENTMIFCQIRRAVLGERTKDDNNAKARVWCVY